MATVNIQNVTKAFGDNVVLREFNATFRDGEFITLLGPSGCGKTTMLRIIAGFEKPTRGEVYIDGTLVSGGKTFVPPEKRGIGMVFQSYAVWPHMNVFDNVAYPLTIRHVSKAEIKTSVERVLGIVHLSQYAERFPNQLSGGQQQRVALARALVAEPKLLLLDEPLSNLDAKLRESMRFEIKEIQRKLGITVVYVTHDQTEAMAMSDRIFLINRGDIQQCGTPQEIYNSPVNHSSSTAALCSSPAVRRRSTILPQISLSRTFWEKWTFSRVKQKTAESSFLPWADRASHTPVPGRERSMSRSGRKTSSLRRTASCTGFWRPSIISEM